MRRFILGNNMVVMRQIVRSLNSTKSRIITNCCYNLSRKEIKVYDKNVYVPHKSFHNSPNLLVKLFMEKENRYAYNIMEKHGYVDPLNITRSNTLSKEEFEQMLSKDWSEESTQEIFRSFPLLMNYCYENNLCISNNMFDNFIDAFTDNIQYSTDEELKSHFFSLAKCPETASIRTRNYVEVWAALDDECINRFKKWSYDEMLSFASLFYMLSATKASDYCYKSVQKLIFKASKLSKPQIVQTLFFISALRCSLHDMHNLELAVQEKFYEFSIDELAIISLGFFKAKVPLRSMTLVGDIIDKIINNAPNINEISLAALLKVIRFSRKIPVDDRISKLLDVLQYEVPRLSIMCNVHIALLATSTLTLHKNCLEKIADFVLKDLSAARLKDLERLTLTFGTFNYIPNIQENFIEKVIEELRKPERNEECLTHGRSFACCVSYLGLLGFYPLDLLRRVLNKSFLDGSYGKQCHAYGREVLCIHNLVKIFHKNTELECLTEKEAVVLAKKHTDYIPDVNFNKQYNVTERMFLDVQKVLEESRGGPEFVVGHHIVTHHQRGDIVICDSSDGTPIPVKGILKSYKFGHLCSSPDKNFWIALIIAGRNAMINNSDVPSGHILSKVRELNALGFQAAPVCWNEYIRCKTFEEKKNYIQSVITKAKSLKNV